MQRFVSGPSERPSVTPAALLMPLEPRIVYDASVSGIGAASHHHFSGTERPGHVDVPQGAAELFRASAPAAAVAGSHVSKASGIGGVTARDPQHPPERSASAAKQVVFVDSNVTDYQSLVAGLPSGTQYVVLNQKTDGLEQIALYLEAHPGIEAVHLVSHGSEAQVQVGGILLDTADLSKYGAELARIGAEMSPGGQLLLYGCDVAEGGDGHALVQQIAALSHLNVAAATGLVGAASLGGNWTLDYEVGHARAPVIFSPAAEQRYGYLLSQTIEDYTSNPSFDSGFTSQFTLDGLIYTIVKSGPQGDNTIGVDPTLQALPSEGGPTNGTGNTLQFDTSEPGGPPTGGISSITIGLANGNAFNMSSLDIDVTANGSVTFTASDGTALSSIISSNGNAVSTTVDFASDPQASHFTDTTSVTISGGSNGNLFVNLGHLVYTEVLPAVVAASGGTTNYVGSTAATVVDSGATVTDTSLGTFGKPTTGTITVSNFATGDTLSFTGSAATGNITATFNNGALTLISADGSSTGTQWTNAFEAVKFSSTSTTYGNRSITSVLNDGTVNSNTTSKTLDVLNPLPVLTADSGSVAFSTSNNVASVPSTPVVIDSTLGLTDSVSSTIQSATVSISGNAQTSTDVLNFTNSASDGNILGAYNAGVLTLTSAGNSATLTQWKAALDSVSFTSTAAVPSNATRTLSFSVTDGNSNASNTATRLVTVTDVDQIPVVTIGNGTTNYVGGTAAVAIDTSIGVSDVDSTNQVSGSVTISNGFSAGDTLAFIPNNILYGNLSGAYNTNNGTLTLTGSATDQQWANAFNSVTFAAANTTSSGVRTVSFIVNDGTFNSSAVTKTVTVTAPPVITTDSGSVAFSTSNNVTSVPSSPVAIDSTLGLVDSGSSTEVSASVSITGNYQNTDVLGFTSNASFGNIVGSYNAGVLTLTSAGNIASLAQWKAALDSVTFTSTAVRPSNVTRTLSFSVTDGNSNVSNTATRLVTVTDLDQIPVVTIGNGTTNYVGGTAAVAIDTSIGVADVDSPNQVSGTVTISSGFSSGDTLLFTSNNTLYGNLTAAYNGSGTLTLTGSANDQQWANAFNSVAFASTSTTYGTRTVSFVVNDGTFNSTAVTKTVNVTDPSPVITTDSGSASFSTSNNVANVTSTPVVIDAGLTFTDPGTSTVQSATVSISGNYQNTDVLGFTSNASFGNVAASYNAGVLTLTSAGNSATLTQWKAALDSVTFTSTAAQPSNATRTLSFSVTDGNSNVSNTATRQVTVTDLDQIPVVTIGNGTTNYVGGTTAVAIDTSIGVGDSDNTTQASGTVTVSGGFVAGDTLAFNNTSNAQFGNVTAAYNGSGTLTLTSAGGTATDAQWANTYDAVTFAAASSTTPGSRTISFVVNDGTVNSAAATKTVDVAAPPIVTADSGSAAFTAGNNVAATPVVIDSGLTFTDAGTSTMQSATVSITGNFENGKDVLSFTNTGSTSFGNIVGAYNAGVLTLTSQGNSATLVQWHAALDSVTYSSTAVTPSSLTRTISFSVTDANDNVSNTATRSVTVTDTDQTPIVTASGGATNYEGGAGAVTIDGEMTVSDLDNTTQSSGTVSIGTGFHSGDTLAFTNTSATLYGNIGVASYDGATGVLTLMSASAAATDAQWANALSAVTFSASAGATPGNRTISFVTSDGTKSSGAATDILDLTAPPAVTTDSGSAAFVAGDNAPSTPLTIDSGLTVTDGSTAVLTSATASITSNFHSGEDVLAFTNTSGMIFGNITGTYNAGAGVLTLTSAGNTATLAQWQAALDAVTYTDTAVTPNNQTRTVSFSATDGNNIVSNSATRTMTVADTDQTPIVTTGGGTTNYVGGTNAHTIDGGIAVSDLDNATQASGTVSIGTGFHSGDTLTFTNTSATLYGNISVSSYDSTAGVLTLTSAGATASDVQWSNALSVVSFSASASAAPGHRTISFVTSDGTKSSTAATDTVDVLGPPTVTADSGAAAFVAGDNVTSPPIVVDSGITLSDASSATLSSATVAVTGNFHAGEDVLSFANDGSTMGNIAASYDATTGVLTMTSSGAAATLTQWRAALGSVTYRDTAVTPDRGTRTISFAVIDGNSYASNVATRAVAVADTDQTPIVTATQGNTVYVAGTGAIGIEAGVTVSDRDNTTQSWATVSIGGGFSIGDTLSFTNARSTVYGNISASYNSATGVMTLTSPGGTATDAQWAGALEAVQFSAASNATPGDRTISFVVNDGTKSSVGVTKTLNVVGPPSIAGDSGAAAFVAADNAASTPVVVDPGITVSDQGSGVLASATVAVTGNFHSGEDALSFTSNGSSVGNISGSYNRATGVLTLTSTDASATSAQWQTALQSVTYTDTAVTPNTAPRTISFSVMDGNGNASNAVSRTVTVRDTDQTPIVLATGGTAGYEVGSPPTAIDGGITIGDRDSTTLASATVSISAGFRNGDQLSLGSGDATYGNIAASYNASTGVLTLTASGATAPISQWQSALEAVRFSSPATALAGSRTISFAVNDGTEVSAVATRTLGVVNIPFAPAKMPHAPVEWTAADDNVASAAYQDVAATPMIVLTAVDPQELAGTFPSVWPSSQTALQGPIGVQPPMEHHDFASQQPFSLALSPPTQDGDGQDGPSTISVEQSDGSALPAWMSYDPATGVVSGVAPGGDPREIHIVVITRHRSGATTRREVSIDFSAHRTPSTHRSAVRPRAPHAALHGAKPSLAEQFASQRSAPRVSRLSSTTRPN